MNDRSEPAAPSPTRRARPGAPLLPLLLLALAAPGAAAAAPATVSDALGDTFAAAGPAIDLTGLAVELGSGALEVRLTHQPTATRPVGYVDIDRDASASTGGVGWSAAEGLPGSAALGMDLYLDLFTYATADGSVSLVSEDGEVRARVPAVFTDGAIELTVPAEHLGGSARVAVAAVVGSSADATDMAPDQGAVVASDASTAVRLLGGRFEVSVTWRTPDGAEGIGRIATRADDSVVFWFFGEDNWEMLVKVLEGCVVNDRYWVFFAATTDVEFELAVTDLASGVTKTYTNPMGETAHTVADTAAFQTCP